VSHQSVVSVDAIWILSSACEVTCEENNILFYAVFLTCRMYGVIHSCLLYPGPCESLGWKIQWVLFSVDLLKGSIHFSQPICAASYGFSDVCRRVDYVGAVAWAVVK
jgi:hypothetical protein